VRGLLFSHRRIRRADVVRRRRKISGIWNRHAQLGYGRLRVGGVILGRHCCREMEMVGLDRALGRERGVEVGKGHAWGRRRRGEWVGRVDSFSYGPSLIRHPLPFCLVHVLASKLPPVLSVWCGAVGGSVAASSAKRQLNPEDCSPARPR
jgi:hypothetical protein